MKKITPLGAWVNEQPIAKRKEFMNSIFAEIMTDLPNHHRQTKRNRLMNWRHGRGTPNHLIQEKLFELAKRQDNSLSIIQLFPNYRNYASKQFEENQEPSRVVAS